jgi:hypothetical protein
MNRAILWFWRAVAGGAAMMAVACSTPVDGKVDGAKLVQQDFPEVSSMLLTRCGSVDCHGSRYRNFRLVGFGASRLATGDRPDSPSATSAAEHAYNYQGIVGLEPEKMSEVAANKGATMGELTFVRKARGDEAHKGDRRIVAGDDADKCLISWFGGVVDTASCKRAATAP